MRFNNSIERVVFLTLKHLCETPEESAKVILVHMEKYPDLPDYGLQDDVPGLRDIRSVIADNAAQSGYSQERINQSLNAHASTVGMMARKLISTI